MRASPALSLGLPLGLACALACTSPSGGSTQTSTTTTQSEPTSGPTTTSEDSESGEPIDSDTDDPPESCPAEPNLTILEVLIDDSLPINLDPGVQSYSCTVIELFGILTMGQSADLECMTDELEPRLFELYARLSTSGVSGAQKFPLELGQAVEMQIWSDSNNLAMVLRAPQSQRLLFAYLYGNKLPAPGFLEPGVPADDFLGAHLLAQVDIGCPEICDPGGGDFLPACDTCSTTMGISVAVGDAEPVVVESNVLGTLPADEPTLWVYPRSENVTSESCGDLDRTMVTLIAAPE